MSLDGALGFLKFGDVVTVQQVQSVFLGDLHSRLGLSADAGLFISPLFFQVFDNVKVIVTVFTLVFQCVGIVNERGRGPFGMIVEAAVAGVEVFAGGFFGRHKAHIFTGLG